MLLCSLEWGIADLTDLLKIAETDPARALKESARQRSSATAAESAPQALAYGILLNRAEKYIEAQTLLTSIESVLETLNLKQELAVCRWQMGVSARFLRANGLFVAALESALDDLQRAGLEIDAARCRRDLSGAYYWQGNLAKAREQIDFAREFFEREKLEADAALCVFAESAQRRAQGKFDEAIEILTRAQKVFAQAHLPVEEAMTQLYQGSVYTAQMKFAQAKEQLNSAHQKFSELNLEGKIATSCYELGISYVQTGDLKEAERFYRIALKIFSAKKMQGDTVNISQTLANVYFYRGDIPRSLSMQRYAQRQYIKLEDRVRIAQCGLNIGLCYQMLGRYGLALRHIEKARLEFINLDSKNLVALSAHNLGKAWLELGNLPYAEKNLNEAIEKYRASNADFPAARSLSYLALTQARQDKLDGALDHLREAREISVASQAQGYVAICDQIGSEVWLKRGDLEQALMLLANAEKIFTELGMMLNTWLCQVCVADIYLMQGDVTHAEEIYLRLFALSESTSPDIAWRCAAGLAQLDEQRGDLTAALEHHCTAMRLLRQMRQMLAHAMLVDSFLTTRHAATDRAIRLAARLQNASTAMKFVEEHRAQLLSSHLQNGRATHTDKTLEEMREHLTELRRRLQFDPNSSSLARLPLTDEQTLLDELHQLGEAYQTRAALVTPAATSSFSTTSTLTQPNQTALVYHWLGKQLLILAITPDEVTIHLRDLLPIDRMALEICASLQPDRRRMLFLNNAVIRHHLLQLDALLLPDPIRARLNPDHLLIILPAGQLHSLPFHALHDGKQFLAQRATLVHADSLTNFNLLQQRANNFASSFESAVIFGVTDFGGQLPRLPSVAEEAAQVSAAFKKSTVMRDEAATPLALRESVRDQSPQVIHLATHAVLDVEHGELSHLVLSNVALFADEIAQMNLKARLVTLSACQSALGKVHRGEESVGLRQAFFAAGAASVLSTLWSVEDEITPRFMQDFYCTLINEKLSPSIALARTQRQWITEDRSLSDWCGFVLHGAA